MAGEVKGVTRDQSRRLRGLFDAFPEVSRAAHRSPAVLNNLIGHLVEVIDGERDADLGYYPGYRVEPGQSGAELVEQIWIENKNNNRLLGNRVYQAYFSHFYEAPDGSPPYRSRPVWSVGSPQNMILAQVTSTRDYGTPGYGVVMSWEQVYPISAQSYDPFPPLTGDHGAYVRIREIQNGGDGKNQKWEFSVIGATGGTYTLTLDSTTITLAYDDDAVAALATATGLTLTGSIEVTSDTDPHVLSADDSNLEPKPKYPLYEGNGNPITPGRKVWVQEGMGGRAYIHVEKTQRGNGTDAHTVFEVWRSNPWAGVWKLVGDGTGSADIQWNANAAAVASALAGLGWSASVTGNGTEASHWEATINSDFDDHELTAEFPDLIGTLDYRTVWHGLWVRTANTDGAGHHEDYEGRANWGPHLVGELGFARDTGIECRDGNTDSNFWASPFYARDPFYIISLHPATTKNAGVLPKLPPPPSAGSPADEYILLATVPGTDDPRPDVGTLAWVPASGFENNNDDGELP